MQKNLPVIIFVTIYSFLSAAMEDGSTRDTLNKRLVEQNVEAFNERVAKEMFKDAGKRNYILEAYKKAIEKSLIESFANYSNDEIEAKLNYKSNPFFNNDYEQAVNNMDNYIKLGMAQNPRLDSTQDDGFSRSAKKSLQQKFVDVIKKLEPKKYSEKEAKELAMRSIDLLCKDLRAKHVDQIASFNSVSETSDKKWKGQEYEKVMLNIDNVFWYTHHSMAYDSMMKNKSQQS